MSRTKICMQSTLNSSELEKWQVIYSRSAEKFLDKLNNKDRKRILDKIFKITENEENLDIKFIINGDGEYRLRVGDYRIIYRKYNNILIIEIIKIDHRKDIYK